MRLRAPGLAQGGQCNLGLHPREPFAYALVRAAAKGGVRILGHRFTELGGPALGAELQGSIEPPGIALCDQWGDYEVDSRRDPVTAQFERFIHHAAQ